MCLTTEIIESEFLGLNINGITLRSCAILGDLTILCLSFLICEMDTMIPPTSYGGCEDYMT